MARPAKRVLSQSKSQSTRNRGRVLNFPNENGSPHWTISATGCSTTLREYDADLDLAAAFPPSLQTRLKRLSAQVR
jgi:hypothetical protein